MRVVIVGAGIGGLTTALSLHQAGFDDVHIYERVELLRPLGVGINLLPHAVRELSELGLADAMAAIGVPIRALQFRNRFGQLIWNETRGIDAGYRWPQYTVHRGELQLCLLDAVRDRLGDQAIHTGTALTHVDHGASVDTAHFQASDGRQYEAKADVIIVADGIHSTFRRQHYPEEGSPLWNGLTMWRGTVMAPPFLDGKTMVMLGDADQKFVAYPLRGGTPGKVRINFVAERRAAEGALQPADWNRPVDADEVARLFDDWAFEWLDIPALVRASDALLEYPMVDRDPIPRWTFDHTTMLGDAAHPLYPIGSNGASQAIIDARVLAFELAGTATRTIALQKFEASRRPLMSDLLNRNRELGPEQVIAIAAERAPQGFADIEDVIPRRELERIADGYKSAAGFAPGELNARASLSTVRSASDPAT